MDIYLVLKREQKMCYNLSQQNYIAFIIWQRKTQLQPSAVSDIY